jgi:hypothetical protein
VLTKEVRLEARVLAELLVQLQRSISAMRGWALEQKEIYEKPECYNYLYSIEHDFTMLKLEVLGAGSGDRGEDKGGPTEEA